MFTLTSEPSYKLCAFFVILIHCFFLFWLYFAPSHFQPAPNPTKHIRVATVHFQTKPIPIMEEKPQEVPVAPTQEEQLFIEEKKPTPDPEIKFQKPISTLKDRQKLPTKSKPKAKKPLSKPVKSSPKKITKNVSSDLQNRQKLLSKAKEKLNQMSKSQVLPDKVLSSAQVPSKIAHLKSDLFIDSPTTLNSQEISYRDELASRLKLLMKLPEYGEVSLKLTINRSGKIIKVQVVQSKSSSNRAHVEKILPTLKMPPFGNNFGNKAEYTFTITMSNIDT